MAAQTPDCLIVGAGPSGLTAATELARRGIPFRIIDNDGLPTPESRALAIHARTLDILEPSGVTDQLLPLCFVLVVWFLCLNIKFQSKCFELKGMMFLSLLSSIIFFPGHLQTLIFLRKS